MSQPPNREGKIVREAWLRNAVELLSVELFNPVAIKLPAKLQVSVGIPHGRKGKKGSSHAIGQCWNPHCSKNAHTEIFIHPEIDDAFEVIEILIHECIHAAGVWNHKKEFKAMAVKVGLGGKMTATEADETLAKRIKAWVKTLPTYPHAGLDIYGGSGDGPKKQGTRMIKCLCDHCGYAVRTSQKWIDVGLPVCPCGEEMQPEGQEGENGEEE